MDSQRFKDKAAYLLSVVFMCSLLVSVAYFFFLRTVQIDITENIVLNYTGENGIASLEVEVSGDDLNQRVQEFLDTVEFEVTPDTGLSNGDMVTITATYDQEVAARYHYEVVNPTRELVVEGLNDRYASLSDIDSDYLGEILSAGQQYVRDNQHEILLLNAPVDQERAWDLDSIEVVYEAFLHSNSSSNSDRVIQMFRLTFVDEDQSQQLYYLVCVPEINDGMQVQTQSIFGERAYLSQDEIDQQAYASYVQRVFSRQFQIESIQEETSEEASDEQTGS